MGSNLRDIILRQLAQENVFKFFSKLFVDEHTVQTECKDEVLL
ncbi:hypothetical protein T10_4831 [Trichinella papuae]|uniref:Uncharacterized protein n=1 Tax=Trichinella papuae TaxID=268474 RepID=A0A0V1LX54_9BILA|nr:hypothetical protein T10_4831 [Trichinella papuae]